MNKVRLNIVHVFRMKLWVPKSSFISLPVIIPWKQFVLPVIAIMALWQLMRLSTCYKAINVKAGRAIVFMITYIFRSMASVRFEHWILCVSWITYNRFKHIKKNLSKRNCTGILVGILRNFWVKPFCRTPPVHNFDSVKTLKENTLWRLYEVIWRRK